jgi:hypothetical protein
VARRTAAAATSRLFRNDVSVEEPNAEYVFELSVDVLWKEISFVIV